MSVFRRIALLLTFAILAVGPTSALGHGASPGSGLGPNPAGHDRGRSHVDPAAHHSLREPVTDQNFYFVMADRFNNGDTANDNGDLPPGKGEGQSGFDPTGKGWYHGGDLKGLTAKLDYIEGLGTTAIWLTPSFKNKAVQPADNSAGYHGYWITDFTQIDPHLGSNADLRTLVDAAHARGAVGGPTRPRISRRTARLPAHRSTTATSPGQIPSPRSRRPASRRAPTPPAPSAASRTTRASRTRSGTARSPRG